MTEAGAAAPTIRSADSAHVGAVRIGNFCHSERSRGMERAWGSRDIGGRAEGRASGQRASQSLNILFRCRGTLIERDVSGRAGLAHSLDMTKLLQRAVSAQINRFR